MIEISHSFDAPELPAYPSLGDPEKVVFFDIETTGLSPYTSALYLIGIMFFRDKTWHFHQWFSASLSDEIPVLQAFSDRLKDFETVVHYNGDTFDIPYLNALYRQYHLDTPFDILKSVDILKAARQLRPLLNPASLRQKHIEEALGIRREDPFTGAELIEVYRRWQQEPEDRLLRDLLLHNEEDVKCMRSILSILSYHEVLNGNALPVSVTFERIPEDSRLFIRAVYRFSFPSDISLSVSSTEPSVQAFFLGNEAVLSVPVIHEELRKYLPNPKQYYYLPREDMVIPKELGSGVDPRNRVPARKENCYVRLLDDFVPAVSGKSADCFRRDLNDTHLWIRLKDVDLNAYYQTFIQNILTFHLVHVIEK